MTLAAFLLAYAGFTALSLAMDRHCEDVCGRPAPPKLRLGLRLLGGLALALSLRAAVAVWGWSYGFVQWLGMLSVAGLLLLWLLAYRPRAGVLLGGVCTLAAMAASWVQG